MAAEGQACGIGSLSGLLRGIAAVDAVDEREVSGLALDSRAVRRGDLFLACAGMRTHGARYIADAVRAGAVAVACEAPGQGGAAAPADVAVPVLPVSGLGQKIGVIAARFYGHPSRALRVIGVTGTNGKTSCSHYLAEALGGGMPCGLIGTLGYGVYGALRPGGHTTPDAVTLQRALAELRAAGAEHVVMEVSSHGLDQGRVVGVDFDGAVFTNLSHDHLDFHGDMAAYGLAKKRLFLAPGLRRAAINLDDEFGRRLCVDLPPQVAAAGYGLDAAGPPDGPGVPARLVWGAVLRQDQRGLELAIRSPWGEGRLSSGLLGRFNASNLLAALSMLLLMEVPLPDALQRLERVHAVAGRMERFGGGAGRPLVVVDYAHSPDALRQVLETLRGHCRGRLWCVFGCGGERDPAKRPLMGAVAEEFADRVVLTDDNPRGEDGAAIVVQIRAGMVHPERSDTLRDRARAIAHAIGQAGEGDVVLVAGKGHEDYQLIGGQKIPFSDREQVSGLLREVA